MSRFYQRYLGSMSDGANVQSSNSNRDETDDPISFASKSKNVKVSHKEASGNHVDKIRARRVEIFNSSESFTPDKHAKLPSWPKPEATKKFLVTALSFHYLFKDLDVQDMLRIVDCMRPIFASVDELIIQQGSKGDLFYCLEVGACYVSKDNKHEVDYEPGDCFGDLALLYNCPRAASVISKTACKLWALDLRSFRQILASTSSAQMMRRCEFLKKCVFLDALTNDQISKLAGALDEVVFPDRNAIIRQGDVADSFYIIEHGSVKCSQFKSNGKSVDLITLKEGDYFGEMALMLNETRHATCTSIGATKCLFLDKIKFYQLLGNIQEVLVQRMRIRILKSVPLLSGLSDDKLAKLSNVMRVQSFKDGTYILKEGDEGSRFYIINEGEVRCTKTNIETGEEEESIRLTPLEFFGERALLTNENRNANVIACGAVECLVLDRSSFEALYADEKVKEDLTAIFTQRERSIESLSAKSPPKPIIVIPDIQPLTDYKYEELQQMRTVGTGTFGRVKLVQHIPTNLVYALKCMNKSDIVESSQERNIMNEKNLLFECSKCEFIIKLYQTYNFEHQIMMLMEFTAGGELWSYIYEKTDVIPRNEFGGFNLPTVKFYSANVILAFQYMHSKGIGYRDLKPENLLLDEKGYIKIIDFGFAKRFPYFKNEQWQDRTYTLCGTPEYLAPEIVVTKGYDSAVDFWALGCLIYELFLTKTPFQAEYTTKIFQNIIASDKTLQFHSVMDTSHINLIKKLLVPNPAFRLGNLSGGVNDLINDPFFSDFDWNSFTKKEMESPYVPTIVSPLDSSNFDEYDEDDTVPEFSGDQEIFANF